MYRRGATMTAQSPLPDRRDSTASLERLFAPRSVAVIGASADRRKIGGRPIRYLLMHGYQGRVFPINPNHTEVQGLPAFAALSEVPGPIDLVVIAVPAGEVPDAVTECGRCGVPFVVVFSAGFAETGSEGAVLQARVGAAAAAFGTRVCGPNSLGLISEPARLTATFAGSLERPGALLGGHVALVSQSGAFGAFIYSMAQDQGVGIRHFISVGNEVDLELADYIDHLAGEEQTRAILGYLEGVRDGSRFLRAVRRAADAGKAVGFIKVGRSEAGRQAALSHTGALTGANQVYDAVFRQAGVTRLEGIQELLDFASLAARTDHPPNERKVFIASISGGAGAWAADAFARSGVEIAPLAESTAESLAAILPPFASRANPVDFTPQVISRPGMLSGTVATLVAGAGAGSVLVVLGLQEEEGVRLAEEIAAAARAAEKLVVVAWLLCPPAAHRVLERAGIPTFDDLSRCVVAMSDVINHGARLAERNRVLPSRPRHRPALARIDGVLDEWQAKRVLAEIGIRVPAGRLVSSGEEAAAAAAAVGYPVVLKAVSSELQHKTDLGLVRAGIADPAELHSAYRALRAAAVSHLTRPVPLLVEEMVIGGVEVGVGIKRDPTFGPVVSFGCGGVLLGLVSDLAVRVGEVDTESALSLVAESNAARLLQGFRGAAPGDVGAVADCLVKLSRFATQAEGLQEAEVNPLVVLPEGQGAVAVDALIVGARGAEAARS